MESAHGSGTGAEDGGSRGSSEAEAEAEAADAPDAPPTSVPVPEWQPGVPDLKEHLPSLLWGAAVPIAVYFLVRHRVHSDAQALIIAGSFSVAWIVLQFVRQRRIDFVGAIVLFGFTVGVASSIVLHGNTYVLKIRDAFFTAVFGAACVITVFTHERPTLFYVSRYLSAGTDPEKVSAYNQLHEHPTGRRTFAVLSIVWGIGLFAEATFRMALADVLPTGTFLAVSPAITFPIIGSLFAFTVVYSKRAQLEAIANLQMVPDVAAGAFAAPAPSPAVSPTVSADSAAAEVPRQIPLP
jgi:hypothetical protein